jgi:5'-nucleotidase
VFTSVGKTRRTTNGWHHPGRVVRPDRKRKPVRLLVTNDDGIESEGIHVLARVLHEAGHDVRVVAPDRDWSGAGAALGRLHPDDTIDVTEVTIPGAPDIKAWSVAGPPGLTVLATQLGAFGEPADLVVSGINAGLNTGRSILHSGTVGAALTGQNFGISGLAVSVAWGDEWYWHTAARCALEVLESHLVGAPPRTVLNLNVPACDYDDLGGVRWARLAAFGAVRAAMADASQGRLQMELTATGLSPEPDTDQGTVNDGYAALTTLVGVVEAWSTETELPSEPPLVSEHVVPGVPLEAVHTVPDASAHRALRRPDLGVV